MAYNQSEKISKLIEEYGFKDYKVYKDLSGIDRVIEVVN
jgi:methylase of polypeptide subunit release factors